MTEVTRVLSAIANGDESASEELLPLVYRELRQMAAAQMAKEKAGHTLQATALVHEAYLRLVSAPGSRDWDSRGHFFAAAAEAMRRILVERARRRNRTRHGGDLQRVDIALAEPVELPPADELLALDEALSRFEQESPDRAKLVKLRYFAGLTLDESAQALGISRATASRYWSFAKAWLYDALRGDSPQKKD